MLLEDTSRRKPSVGLTPLIDVVFILLIFFMLVVQFKRYQQVPLSVVETAELTPNYVADAWIVRVEGGGACLVREQTIACAEIGAVLPAELAKPVILNFADRARLGEIVAMQSALIALGHEVVLGIRLERGQ